MSTEPSQAVRELREAHWRAKTHGDFEGQNRKRADALKAKSDLAELEVRDIHAPIREWCDYRNVPYIYSRSDKRSTIGSGIQDFTIFYRGQAICIECKTRTGQLSDAQIEWANRMQKQGFIVRLIRGYQQFLEIVKT